MPCKAQPGKIGTLCLTLLLSAAAQGADPPYGLGDIVLGASYARLAAALDFRDIHAAVAEQKDRKTTQPDLGRRGYGCARRDDPYADLACVSHDERVGGAATREIRLHFLEGRLQQFSVTAEIRHYDAVMEALRERYGAPQTTEPVPAGGYASSGWRNAESRIVSYGGTDLVFVSFELAGYQDAVKRKSSGARANECR